MKQMVRKMFLLATLMGVFLLMGATDVNAFFGSHGSWGSHGGSWASGGGWGSNGGSWGSHGGSHGSHGGFLRRIFRGSHGSNGSWGSHGSNGSWGGHNSCGSCGGGYYHDDDDNGSDDNGGDAPPPPENGAWMNSSRYGRVATAARLNVNVPADAVVYVNETRTKSTGESRHYISRGLLPNEVYAYTVRAEYARNGEPVVESKVAQVTAGEQAELTFGAASSDTTKLTLHVPADAKVTLAGSETKQTGEVREFSTSKLAAGQTWANYTVRVEVVRDGETIEEERTLTLVGGKSQELSFNLDGMQIASR